MDDREFNKKINSNFHFSTNIDSNNDLDQDAYNEGKFDNLVKSTVDNVINDDLSNYDDFSNVTFNMEDFENYSNVNSNIGRIYSNPNSRGKQFSQYQMNFQRDAYFPQTEKELNLNAMPFHKVPTRSNTNNIEKRQVMLPQFPEFVPFYNNFNNHYTVFNTRGNYDINNSSMIDITTKVSGNTINTLQHQQMMNNSGSGRGRVDSIILNNPSRVRSMNNPNPETFYSNPDFINVNNIPMNSFMNSQNINSNINKEVFDIDNSYDNSLNMSHQMLNHQMNAMQM